MDIGGTALAFYGLGAGVVAASLVALKRRLQLSKAKHASLSGHARMARRIAALVPFYEYDERRFFCSDNAPAKIAALRRDGFMRLSALYASRFGETARHTAEVVKSARHKDRKSTRLNSSHQIISYAVFCLKKKKEAPTLQVGPYP